MNKIDIKELDQVFDTMKLVHKNDPSAWRKQIVTQLTTNDGIDEFRNLAKIKAIIQNFIEEQDITCAETIYQSDRVIVNAYDFIEELVELVGYKESENDDE